MQVRTVSIFAVVAAVMLATAGIAQAMPSDADSNTWQLKRTTDAFEMAWPVGLGATGDFVLDRTLDLEDTDGRDLPEEDMESTWYGGNIYLDLLENVHLNFFIGVVDIELGSVAINNNNTTKLAIETDSDLAGGGSGKVDIYSFPVFAEQPNMWLFATGGYRYGQADVDSVVRGTTPASAFGMEVEVSEWQAALGLSQRFDHWIEGIAFVPYGGVKYNDVDVNVTGFARFPLGVGNPINENVKTGHRESDGVVGVFAGLTLLTWDDRIAATVEGRFVDETAVSVNGHLRW